MHSASWGTGRFPCPKLYKVLHNTLLLWALKFSQWWFPVIKWHSDTSLKARTLIVSVFMAGCCTCSQNIDCEYVLYLIRRVIKESACSCGEHQRPSERANSICLAHSPPATSQIIAYHVLKQRLSLCTQKSTVQLAGIDNCNMCSARLFWYLIDSCDCQWTNIMCGLVEHDVNLLMQEFCDSFWNMWDFKFSQSPSSLLSSSVLLLLQIQDFCDMALCHWTSSTWNF